MFSFLSTKIHGFINRTTVMNKFLSLGGVCVAAALLSGCSDNELASVETSVMNAIGFHVVGSQAETKATPITSTNITTTDFDVFAFKGETIYMGENSTGFEHKGVQINHTNGAWDYANAADRHYWPSEALNFYAVNPATFDSEMRTNYGWNIHYDKQEIHYLCTNEYESNSLPANIDVMYAIAKDQKKDTNGGKVKLQFKHILSQVVFKAKANTDMEVTINAIKIHNVNARGTFKFPETATANPAQSNWDLNSYTLIQDFTVVKNQSITVNSTGADISSNTPMLFVPQPLTAWNTTYSTAQADTDKESYLEISCKIQQSGSYLFGDATNFKKLYVPFGADWQPGKRYIYTLIFGGGYDADGNAILTPIEFVPEVKDWVEESGNVDL